MSVKEAQQVNESFKNLKDSIYMYRESLFSLEKEFSAYTGKSLQIVGEHLKDKKYALAQRDSINSLYLINKKIYENSERNHRRSIFNQQLFTLSIALAAIFFAAK